MMNQTQLKNMSAAELREMLVQERQGLADFYNPNVLVNIGPSHPAMHGTLRAMCRVNGEVIEDATCEIGYLHRAIEKLAEHRTYHQWIVYTDRLNYCSALANNVAYVKAVEELLDITPTERCQWIRVICMELARVIDHLICVAINALDMGALTIFWYLYHWREEAYTMIEGMCGMRLTTSYARIGGMMYDLPDNFASEMAKFVDGVPRSLDDVEKLLTSNRIWVDRTKDVGTLTAEEAINFGVTGPCLRASGVDFDLRRDRPYYTYPEIDFDVVIGKNGDVYDRYLLRMEEIRQSIRILKQCMQKLPKGPLWVEDRRVRIPEKKDVYEKMEVLIHHFKIFMEGIDVPPGETYSCIESPNGELGFYIVSRGGPKAWRIKIKSPSLLHFQTFEHTVKGAKIPDAIAVLGSLNIIAGELDR
jgi:NADH dehydrogenase I D subunit